MTMILILLNLILLVSEPDRPYLISEITVSGNETTQDFIILREVPVLPGDVVVQSQLEYFRDRIYSLGLFTRVDYHLDSLETGFRLTFTVHERWYWLVHPTLNFKTQDRGKPWDVSEWKDLTYGFVAFHNNVLGRQISMRIAGQNGYSQGLSIGFFDPNSFIDPDLLFWFGLNYSRLAVKNKFEDSNPDARKDQSLGAYFGSGFRFNPYTVLSLTLNYKLISIPGTYSDSSLDVLLNNRLRKDKTIGLATAFSIDARNSSEFATKGFFSVSEVSVNRELGTGKVYSLLHFDKRAYFKLSEWFTLAGLASYETGLGHFIPFYEHLLTGKDEYLRGYQSIILESTERWVFRTEFRHQVIAPRVAELSWMPVKQFRDFRWGLYALAFGDAGYINRPNEKYKGLEHYISENNLGSYYNNFLYSGGVALNLLLPYSVVLKAEFAFIPNGKPTLWFMTGKAF